MGFYSQKAITSNFEPSITSRFKVIFVDGETIKLSNNFNILKEGSIGYLPATEVSYNQVEVVTKSITGGPNSIYEVEVPHYRKMPRSFEMTIIDEHKKRIRYAILDWINQMPIKKGRALSLKAMKKYSMRVEIREFDITGQDLQRIDKYYIIPSASLDKRFDTSFSAESIPLQFNIVGVLE